MSSSVKFYAGPLTEESAHNGILLAKKQAEQLARDAKTLLDSGSYATSTALATLSIEESSKVLTIRKILLVNDPKSLAKIWKNYRSHSEKSLLWRILGSEIVKITSNENSLELNFDFSGSLQKFMGSDSNQLHFIKQLSLYTDCTGTSPTWSLPANVVSIDLAARLVKSAETIVEVFGGEETIETLGAFKEAFKGIDLDKADSEQVSGCLNSFLDIVIRNSKLPAGYAIKMEYS